MNRTAIRLLNLLFTLPFLVMIYLFSAEWISEELGNSKIGFIIAFVVSLAIQLFIWEKVGAGFKTLTDFAFNTGFFLSSFVFTIFALGKHTFYPGNLSGLEGFFLGPLALVLGSVIGLIVGIIVRIIKKHKYPTV
jgi:hypothetical protein